MVVSIESLWYFKILLFVFKKLKDMSPNQNHFGHVGPNAKTAVLWALKCFSSVDTYTAFFSSFSERRFQRNTLSMILNTNLFTDLFVLFSVLHS